MLVLSAAIHAAMVAHAYNGLPDEACGLMVGRLDRTDNGAGSGIGNGIGSDGPGPLEKTPRRRRSTSSSRV